MITDEMVTLVHNIVCGCTPVGAGDGFETMVVSTPTRASIRAALEAYEAAQWRPIETAPKDGTAIVVWGQPQSTDDVHFSRPSAFTAYWDDMGGTFCLSGADWRGPFIHPTHWRPLPAPPKEMK